MVPGLGTNLFSVTAAMLKGLFHPTNPRLEKDGVVVPMQQLGVDDTTGKVMYSIKVKLGVELGTRWSSETKPGRPCLEGEAVSYTHLTLPTKA